MADKSTWREPYVGEGADGARRSAQIDREEADTYPTGGDRWQDCHSSALAWERQAREIEREQIDLLRDRVTQAACEWQDLVNDLDASAALIRPALQRLDLALTNYRTALGRAEGGHS